MGNRAVLQFGEDDNAVGIYLHWNGGEESVQAFLDAAKQLNVRPDGSYEIARLSQIIGNFFGGTLSLGIGLASKLDQDNGDNGTFIIEDLKIKKRTFKPKSLKPGFDRKHYDDVLEETLKKNRSLFIKETI